MTEKCSDCGGLGYYTTEGSKEACEASGCVVLEDGQDGTCVIQCVTCHGKASAT